MTTDLGRCTKQVSGRATSWPRYHQCKRKAVIVDGKAFCTVHSPAKVVKRDAKVSEKWNAKWDKTRYERAAARYCRAKGLTMEDLVA